MSDVKFSVNVGMFKLSFWMTVILAILKIAHIINISNWLVFLPLLVSIAIILFFIFLVGLITIVFLSNHWEEFMADKDDSSEEKDEITD